MILQPGTTLKHGDYTIIEKLGDGGFGITYLAEQTILGRKVAIKELFLSKICTRDGNTVTVPTDGIRNEFDKQLHNFLKEARNIAKMRHSGIVPVIDMFEENGTAYYVMEYFSRGSLAQLQKSRPGGRLQESEALRYIRQIADALSYVHSKNLLHLDLKPGNILLDDNNNAILIDFGICKHYDESGNITVSTNSIETSRTPGYAPFEQYIALNLKQFSPSTDIYSLGATFYKLLTGNTPPPANERYYDDTIPPLPDEISASTRTAIEQAMRMDKRQRPQNIDEFLALLDASPTSADKSDETTKINPDDVEVTILNIAPESESTKPAPPTAPEPIEVKPEKPIETPTKKSGVFKWVAAVTFLLLLAVAGINWWSNYQAEQAEQQRLAAIEQACQDSIAKVRAAQKAEQERLAAIEQARKDSIAKVRAAAKKRKKYDWKGYYNSDGLAPVGLNGKYGFIDKSGNEVIPLKYDNAGSFSEGRARVKLNGKYGFIDKSGNEVIPCKYDDFLSNSFSDGTVPVKLNGKYGFIDKSGNVVIPLKYDGAGSFKEGLGFVKLNGKWGFIDKSGKVVIPLKYDYAYFFTNGRAQVELNGERFYIDKKGNRID